jgi:hypothetical protein
MKVLSSLLPELVTPEELILEPVTFDWETRFALMHRLEHASGRVYPIPSREINRRCFFRARVICSTDNPNMRCCLWFDKKPTIRSIIIYIMSVVMAGGGGGSGGGG